MVNEEKLALVREVVPKTLRSLFMLRISLCVLAAGLALVKILLSPPSSGFFLDILRDTEIAAGLEVWMRAANLAISGLLAVTLSLVIATFLIQARLQSQVDREREDMQKPTLE
jgi:hypothetical protein